MRPVIDGSHQREHEGRHNAVGEHLQHRAAHSDAVQRGDAHKHVAHVADAGVPDDVLQVLLRHRRHRAVQHVHRAQPDKHRHPPRIRGLRQQENPHPDDTVGPQLHQHPGVQHGHRRGRRHVAVGRPRVERPETRQRAEADHKQREHQHLELGAEPPVGRHLSQRFQRERAVALPRRLRVDRQYPHPDEYAAGHEEDDELHRPVFFGADKVAELAAAAPDTDKQVHRQHGQLVEEEQEEQVPHRKHAVHPGGQRQQQHEELTGAVGDVLRDYHPAHQHNAVQHHQRSRNPVNAQRQADVHRPRQPVVGADELEPATVVVVPGEYQHRQNQGNRPDKQREIPRVLRPVARHEHHQPGPGQRHQNQQQQRNAVEVAHGRATQLRIPLLLAQSPLPLRGRVRVGVKSQRPQFIPFTRLSATRKCPVPPRPASSPARSCTDAR